MIRCLCGFITDCKHARTQLATSALSLEINALTGTSLRIHTSHSCFWAFHDALYGVSAAPEDVLADKKSSTHHTKEETPRYT